MFNIGCYGSICYLHTGYSVGEGIFALDLVYNFSQSILLLLTVVPVFVIAELRLREQPSLSIVLCIHKS